MQIFIEGSLTVVVVLKEEGPKQMGPGATAKSKQGFVSEKRGLIPKVSPQRLSCSGEGGCTFNPSTLKAEASVVL